MTFSMNFRSFFGVIFATFFDSAFSNKGCCCKVRHASILWFLQRILTISTFYVFLENARKTEILARNSMQKSQQILARNASKIRCKKTWKFVKNPWNCPKNHGKLLLGRFFWPFRAFWPLSLATKRVAEARCHVATATKRPVARGKWPVARGRWLVVSVHPKVPRGSGFWI